MERWLSQELSRRLGVLANARFPFPRVFIDETFNAVLGDEEAMAQRFSREALGWLIAALCRMDLFEFQLVCCSFHQAGFSHLSGR
jgi:exonuclease V gamma subunit